MLDDMLQWAGTFRDSIAGSEQINDAVWHIQLAGCSHLYQCMPWNGVYLWANRIADRHIPYGEPISRRYATLNYCIGGRCEVCLPDDTYIYMEPGMLCIDCHQPKDGYGYPTSDYTGLELAFDLDFLRETPPPELEAYGDFEGWIETLLENSNGSYLASVTEECRLLIEALFRQLTEPERRIEEHRFHALCLLYRLMHGDSVPTGDAAYVTKGQRQIADEVERRVTNDLSRRFTVKELADGYGISPSALKQYFEKVYGLPISRYLREKRVARAKDLLAATKMSVSEIAVACGWEHQGKFGEVFREQTGVAPLEYRRLYYKKKGET